MSAGFTDVEAHLIGRPTPVPAGAAAWLDTFARSMQAQLPAGGWVRLRDATVERLRPVLCDDEGNWTIDYVRLRCRAVRATGSTPGGVTMSRRRPPDPSSSR